MKKSLLALFALLLFTCTAAAQHFTVQTGTFAMGAPRNGEDIFLPGPVPFWTAGLGAPFNIEVDAFTYGLKPLTDIEDQTQFDPIFDFSVDRSSLGLSGTAVDAMVLSGQPPQTSIFRSINFSGTNGLMFNGVTDFGLDFFPRTRQGTDGYDRRTEQQNSIPERIYFSVRQGDLGRHGSDIMVSSMFQGFVVGRAPFASANRIGLQAGDEIDALEVVDQGAKGTFDRGDLIFFSLARNSTSLNQFGLSPADIFVAQIGPAGNVNISIVAFASQLGLRTTDELNALSISRLLNNPVFGGN